MNQGHPHEKEPEDKAEVSDAIDQKGLRGGCAGARPLIPMSDQEVGTESDRLPEDEQLQRLSRHHQHQHREG